jgi:hypothetical protein
VGLERDLLSLVSTIEELLGRRSSGSCLESRKYGHRDLSRWQRGSLCSQKFSLTSPKSGGRSVGIVRSWTQAMEFFWSPAAVLAIEHWRVTKDVCREFCLK